MFPKPTNLDQLKDKRILIVEDDPVNMAVVAATLKNTGAIIIRDYWTTDVLPNIIKNLPIDLIILDVMLRHNLSGFDVMAALQTSPRLNTIPVVMVSAADPELIIPQAQAMGCIGFIAKPIRPQLFPNQILDCINRKAVWYIPPNYLLPTQRV